MAEALQEAFRYSAWASKTLIGGCRPLSADQLRAPAPGYGGILATLNHFISSDAGYVAILGGTRLPWVTSDDEVEDLDQLATRVDRTAALWERLLTEGVDADRLLILENGAYECRAGVVLVQALHHANVHREQVSAALTGLTMELPDIQPWAFADATGRATWRTQG